MPHPLKFLTPLLCAAAIASGAAPATHKHLLLDSRVIATSRNVAIEVGTATKFLGNPLFGQEYPWEPCFANMYTSVIWDEDEHLYKCWYNLFDVYQTDWKRATKQKAEYVYRQNAIAYATSTDAVHWKKPLRADRPFEGQPSNLLVRGISGVGVIKDRHETDPARRYKMFLRRDEGGKPGNPAVSFSADGIHWDTPTDVPNVKVRADTYNNAIWAPTLGKYVAMTRDWGPATGIYPEHSTAPILNKHDRIRLVARSESDDFVHWTNVQTVLKGSDDIRQVYTLPLFYYEGIYLGFPALYNILTERVQTELAWSPDTIHWERISPGQALVAPSDEPGSYDYGCVYMGAPVVTRDEIMLYYGGSDAPHTGFRATSFCLATLRPDGFAGATPADPAQTAELTTVPLERQAGDTLLLTADIAAGGSLQTVVLDAADGREIGRLPTLTGEQRLTAKSIPLTTLAASAHRPVKLRFILHHAKVYSFSL